VTTESSAIRMSDRRGSTGADRSRAKRRAITYVAVGVINTTGYFLVYNILRTVFGPFTANTLSVAASITFSFWANRRFTFERRGRERVARQFTAFSLMFVMTLLLSNVALFVLFRVHPDPALWLENVALIGSSAMLLGVRYLLMRRIFRPRGVAALAAAGPVP
jgi:putative flippase GtrA